MLASLRSLGSTGRAGREGKVAASKLHEGNVPSPAAWMAGRAVNRSVRKLRFPRGPAVPFACRELRFRSTAVNRACHDSVIFPEVLQPSCY